MLHLVQLVLEVQEEVVSYLVQLVGFPGPPLKAVIRELIDGRIILATVLIAGLRGMGTVEVAILIIPVHEVVPFLPVCQVRGLPAPPPATLLSILRCPRAGYDACDRWVLRHEQIEGRFRRRIMPLGICVILIH